RRHTRSKRDWSSDVCSSDLPVNQAYEAATADLDDNNIIDPYHLAAYRSQAVSYNRDVEAFPLLKAMLEKLYGTSPYKSPTDMGRSEERRVGKECRSGETGCD